MKKYVTRDSILIGTVGVVALILGIIFALTGHWFGVLFLIWGGAGMYGLWQTITEIRNATCKSCQKIMKGADYEVEALESVNDGNKKVTTVRVTAVCPYCGEYNYFDRKVKAVYTDGSGKVHCVDPMSKTKLYCQKIFRSK